MKNDLEKFIGQEIVVDTDSSWVYAGTLKAVTDHCLILSSVDAHDNTDTSSSKELYIFDSRRTGIKSNRKAVHVVLDRVVSFSLLDDVKQF